MGKKTHFTGTLQPNRSLSAGFEQTGVTQRFDLIRINYTLLYVVANNEGKN